jgi:hypothetical protein
MFPVSTLMGGTAMAMPDTCKTPAPPGPPIPVPYPNTAMMMLAIPPTCTKKVFVLAMPVLTVQSKIAMTAGDEPGAAGGVVSGTIMGPAKFTMGSLKVKMEGQAVVYQTCPTGHNGSSANAPVGVQDAPSQEKVFVAM